MPKFRAYCKFNKTIYEVLLIDFKAKIEQIKLRKTGNIWYDFEDVVLMQSTGLHDKNGVEIFEGDIVKPRFGKSFVVKHFIFGQDVFKAALITSDGHGFDGIYHGSLVEVIGNVEQNPELLEDV